MNRKTRYSRVIKGLHNWIIFFVLFSFVITCCLMLFISVLSNSLGIVFSEEHLSDAAKLTFINVIFISLLFTVFDSLRRWFMVNRPVNKILDAAKKITKGDFSARIQPVNTLFADDGFNKIIECFNKMAEELSGIETLRADFIANVSHELKTPLAVMQNYGTMLQQPVLSDEKRLEYSNGITEAARRLSNLITNILKLNKLENQQMFPSVKEYNLSEQICESLLQFENEWEKKKITIKTDIEDGVKIRSDEELLSLVWNNLFSNAMKFTGENGTVSVSLESKGDVAVINVKDTGCGMTPEVGAHIFEKFYQGDTSHSEKGNGLGLALVKRVVDIMHGEIRVESVLGKGSSFTVEFDRNLSKN